MRGAFQVGFSAIIRKINSRTSVGSFFLPTWVLAFEIQLQYSRKPARCQRTTVSGLTSTRDCFQAPQKRRANTQKVLSTAPIRGLGLRFSTASCCRRARFFRSRLRCDCKQRLSRPSHNPTKILSLRKVCKLLIPELNRILAMHTRVAIAGSRASENWETGVEGVNGFERTYTLGVLPGSINLRQFVD